MIVDSKEKGAGWDSWGLEGSLPMMSKSMMLELLVGVDAVVAGTVWGVVVASTGLFSPGFESLEAIFSNGFLV